MISVVIPTLNAERHLPATLVALVPAAVDGIVREVIVVDGGSTDRTQNVADHAGTEFLNAEQGRGSQLSRGAAKAKFPWLLFLHADTVLEDGWERAAVDFMHRVDHGEHTPAAAAFRFKLDDKGFAPRTLEALVKARCAVFKLPYGDQGLLISSRLYNEAGGFRSMPIMEDVDIVRRLGRKRIAMLKVCATTSAERYRREGYIARSLRNHTCLALYSVGLPIATISRIYGHTKPAPVLAQNIK
jgi:rSAM/selenodomain-associated transferase 2